MGIFDFWKRRKEARKRQERLDRQSESRRTDPVFKSPVYQKSVEDLKNITRPGNVNRQGYTPPARSFDDDPADDFLNPLNPFNVVNANYDEPHFGIVDHHSSTPVESHSTPSHDYGHSHDSSYDGGSSYDHGSSYDSGGSHDSGGSDGGSSFD